MLLAVTACGGGGHHSDGSGDGGSQAKSCTEQFDPDLAAAGDDCTPTYNTYCPDATQPTLTNETTVGACDGVTVTSGSVASGDLTSSYDVLTPDSGGGDGLVIALHWSNGTGASMADHMRLSELAKARNVTVVVPTAPDPVPFRTWGNSVVVPISTRAERIALLDELVAQLRGTAKADAGTPIFVEGVSGGAVMAFQYACARADVVAGAEIVAAELLASDLEACQPSRPLATVQVQGTSDLISSYPNTQEAFDTFVANNGCTGADVKHASMPVPDGELVSGIDIAYTGPCASSGIGSALVTINGGGHSWPGGNRNFDIFPFSVFGAVTNGFDATLQGYDLLRYLGG